MSGPPPPPPNIPIPKIKTNTSKFKFQNEDTDSHLSLSELIQKNTTLAEEEKDLPSEIINAPKTDVLKKIECSRCQSLIAEDFMDAHMTSHSSEILPFLYLGGQRNAHNKKELSVRTNVKHIMNLATEVKNLFVECRVGCECTNGGADCTRHLGLGEHLEKDYIFNYINLQINDKPGENIYDLFDKTYEMIENIRKEHEEELENPRPMLIHCVAGISRSSSIVIAYIMKYRKWGLKKSYEFVKQKRSLVSPISYFIEQLQKYEEHLINNGIHLEGYDMITKKPTLLIEDVYGSDVIWIQAND